MPHELPLTVNKPVSSETDSGVPSEAEAARQRQKDAESMMTEAMKSASSARESIRGYVGDFSQKTLDEFEETFDKYDKGAIIKYTFSVGGHSFAFHSYTDIAGPGESLEGVLVYIDGMKINDKDRADQIVKRYKPLIRGLIKQRQGNELVGQDLEGEREQMLVDEVLAIK